MPRPLAILLCLAAVACKKGPRYCDQDIGGIWINATDPHYAYRFQEDGGVVRGEYLVRSDDGGLSAPPEAVTFDLKRTHESVGGWMHGKDTTAGGKECPVDFDTKITDCKPGSLQVLSEIHVAAGEDCKRLTLPDGGEMPRYLREYVLIRPPEAAAQQKTTP